MSVTCVSEFLRVFRSRREYCRALLELSQHQALLIAADDYTELLSVLGQKQRVLGRLDEFSRQYTAIWRRWKLERDGLDVDVRADCEHVLAETEALLAELVEQEQQSSELLTRRRDETQRQLQAISEGSVAHDAYRDGLEPAPYRQLDVGR